MLLTYIRGVCFKSTYNLEKLAQRQPSKYLELAKSVVKAKQERIIVAKRDTFYEMLVSSNLSQLEKQKSYALDNKERRYNHIFKNLKQIENKTLQAKHSNRIDHTN